MIEDIPMPPKPTNLINFLHALNQDGVDIGYLSKTITQDLAISTAILKTVNSPFLKMSQEIISIQQAIVLLGLDNIKNLLLCFSLKNAFDRSDDVFLQEFWKQTYGVSLISAALAHTITNKPSDESFTYSMVCDIAVPAIAAVNAGYGECYLQHSFSDSVCVIEAEDKSYYIDHCVVGEFIAHHWNLPPFLRKGIELHHTHTENFGYEFNRGNADSIVYTAIHYLAEHVYGSYKGYNDSFEWCVVKSQVYSVLGIKDQLVTQLKNDLLTLYQEAALD